MREKCDCMVGLDFIDYEGYQLVHKSDKYCPDSVLFMHCPFCKSKIPVKFPNRGV